MYQGEGFRTRLVNDLEMQEAGESGRLLGKFIAAAGLKVQVSPSLLDARQCFVDFVSDGSLSKCVYPFIGDGYGFSRGKAPLGAASHTLKDALSDLFQLCCHPQVFVEVCEQNKPTADFYRMKPTGYLKFPEPEFRKLIS